MATFCSSIGCTYILLNRYVYARIYTFYQIRNPAFSFMVGRLLGLVGRSAGGMWFGSGVVREGTIKARALITRNYQYIGRVNLHVTCT